MSAMKGMGEISSLAARFLSEWKLTPTGRSWGGVLIVGAIASGVGAGYFFLPPAPPPIAVLLPEAGRTETTPPAFGMAVPASRRVTLKTPFAVPHEAREAPAKPFAAPVETPPALKFTAAPAKAASAKLVGVVTAERGSRAILLCGGRQIVLAPGDSCGSLTLLAVTEQTATVREGGTERILRMTETEGRG